MTDSPANPTDTAICGLLAGGPLPTAALAAQLAIPERTARHRLYRLRQAGVVVTDPDGRHHLAASAASTTIAGPLPVRDSTATTAAIAGPLPSRDGTAVDLAAPVMAPDHLDQDGSSARPGRGWGPGAVLGVVAVALAVAAGIAIKVRMFRMAPPPAPAPPPATGFVYPGDPWGGMPW